MADYPVSGGCACGGVRYELLAPPLSVQHCHCETCRKISGEFTSTGAVVHRADIAIAGADSLTTYYSSASFRRDFCRTCGCYLFAYEDSEPELMYFAPATIDGGRHPGHPPGSECHIYVRSKAEWETIADGLPQYQAASPDEIVTGLQRVEAGAAEP
jgi:hypothetical protein